MPICYLHVGAHKTGTTAIQMFLSQNRDFFARNRILVPASGSSQKGSHIILVHRMIGRPVAERYQDPLAALQAEMLMHRDHDLLISAELLESVLRQSRQRHPIVEYFTKAGYEVRLILYVRNAPQRINAQYAQRVKMFRFGGDFSEVLAKEGSRSKPGLARWLEIARVNQCPLVARPYTGPIQAGRLIEDFMQVLGFDVDGLSDRIVMPGRVNESVGPTAIAVARRLMTFKSGAVMKHDLSFKSWCGRKLLEEIKSQNIKEAKFSGIDTTIARQMEQNSQASDDCFAQAVWGKDWNEVFSSDVAEPFQINDFAQCGMTPEEQRRVDDLAMKLWPRIESKLNNGKRMLELSN